MERHQHPKFGDQATKEDIQAKFVRQLIAVLRDNREALCHVPEIFEKLIEIQHTPEAKDVTTETPETARKEELMLAQRENDDLVRQNQHLMNDNAVKDKRINTLEGTVEDLKRQIKALKTTGSAKTSRDNRLSQKDDRNEDLKELMGKTITRNDELLANIGEKEQELAQQVEKIKTLEATIEDQKGQIRALANNGKSSAIGWFYDTINTWWFSIPSGNDDLLAKIAEKEANLEQQAKRIAELEINLQAIAKENGERGEKLIQLEEFHKSKDKEIERLKMRIAALSERRVKQDQSKVEDTLSENRQSMVEEDFANFFDGMRMDTCEKIQTSYSFKEPIEVDIYCPRLLCLVFEAAYEKMEEAKRAIFELGKEVTRGFIQSAPEEIKSIIQCKRSGFSKTSMTYTVYLGRQESQYPVEAVDALMMILKETAPKCNLDCLVEDVIQVVKRKWNRWQEKEKLERNSRLSHAVSHINKPLFQEYIKASIRLTWRMVTQAPPLKLEYQSVYLQRCHKKMGYHMSPEMRSLVKGTPDQDQEEEIACYLWPGLLDGEGRCIRKGEVLCKIKGNTK